jgi:hypothetical protein
VELYPCSTICLHGVGRDVSFTVVIYGCETRFLTLKEEHRLRVFKSRMPMKIFGSEKEEVIGDWRKLHNEELHDRYC